MNDDTTTSKQLACSNPKTLFSVFSFHTLYWPAGNGLVWFDLIDSGNKNLNYCNIHLHHFKMHFKISLSVLGDPKTSDGVYHWFSSTSFYIHYAWRLGVSSSSDLYLCLSLTTLQFYRTTQSILCPHLQSSEANGAV